MPSPPEAWQVVRSHGCADDLHSQSGEALAIRRRQIRVLTPSQRALVLGPSQKTDAVDFEALERRHVGLARRRSGGSAVLVGPQEILWVDVVVPSGDPLWQADVSRAARWIGGCWAVSFGSEADVWRGAMRHTPWSRTVCFAGLGPGEVTIAGRKVVGISQRRTQQGALFQSAVMLSWQPDDYEEMLKLPAGAATGELDAVAVGIGVQRGRQVADAFVKHVADLETLEP